MLFAGAIVLQDGIVVATRTYGRAAADKQGGPQQPVSGPASLTAGQCSCRQPAAAWHLGVAPLPDREPSFALPQGLYLCQPRILTGRRTWLMLRN